MAFFTKYWRSKLLTAVATLAATFGVWGALAWPDWTSAGSDWSQEAADPNIVGLQALAALPPEQLAALVAPPPVQAVAAAPPPSQPQYVYRQVVVVTRHEAPVASFAEGDVEAGEPASAAETSSQPQSPASTRPQPADPAPAASRPSPPQQPAEPAPAQPAPPPAPPPPTPVPPPPPPPTATPSGSTGGS